MKYPDQQIEIWKREINAIQVIGTRVKMERDGKDAIGLCPFHSENTPSFRVYRKDGVWLYHCFGCSASGNAFQFFQKMDKISWDDAVEKVLSISGWQEGKESVDRIFVPTLENDAKKVLTYPLNALNRAESALAGSLGESWLKLRGVGTETAKMLHIGFVSDLSAVNPAHPWVKDGWLVFPTIRDDKITCVKYRSIRGKKTEDGKKSGILRAPNMATSLYNLNSIVPFDDAFLVEGEPDVLTMAQAGYNAAGLPSAEYVVTAEERDTLIQANRIFLAGDMDGVGRAAMIKLWGEIRERAYLIEWPVGCKDANDAYLKECHGDVEKFQDLVEKLKAKALERPMDFIYDLKHSMRDMDKTSPMDNPERLRFPWPAIDTWTPIVPGDIMTLFATESKTGKSTWLMNILLHNVLNYGKVVVNYSAELLPPAYARRVVSYLTRRDRNLLTKEDYEKAIERMGDARFYNGYQPKADYKKVVDLLILAKKRLGAHIFVVDHLHFLTRGTRDENHAVAEAMRLLKDFAFDYGAIVIVVGQPRKMATNQRGREATAQDAKSSEAFGSDASQVFILHRDRTGQSEGEAIFSPITKVKLDYSRESQTKFTNLIFEGNTCTFYETFNHQSVPLV